MDDDLLQLLSFLPVIEFQTTRESMSYTHYQLLSKNQRDNIYKNQKRQLGKYFALWSESGHLNKFMITLSPSKNTMDAAWTLAPEHLSLYCLTIEENTPLAKGIKESQIVPPDPDLAADMYELAEKTLKEAGFFHYEISNWARSDHESCMCQHNLTYWRNEPWLGIGAGAHSWLDKQRWANVYHPQKYIEELERDNRPIIETEPIDQPLEMGETMIMGLRLAEGIDDVRFRARFGVGLATAFGAELAELQDLGLLVWDNHTTRLTAKGRLLGNQVFIRFV